MLGCCFHWLNVQFFSSWLMLGNFRTTKSVDGGSPWIGAKLRKTSRLPMPKVQETALNLPIGPFGASSKWTAENPRKNRNKLNLHQAATHTDQAKKKIAANCKLSITMTITINYWYWSCSCLWTHAHPGLSSTSSDTFWVKMDKRLWIAVKAVSGVNWSRKMSAPLFISPTANSKRPSELSTLAQILHWSNALKDLRKRVHPNHPIKTKPLISLFLEKYLQRKF